MITDTRLRYADAVIVDDGDRDRRPMVETANGAVTTTASARSPGLGRHLTRSAFIVVTALAFGVTGQIAVVSGLQHKAAQVRAFAALRNTLAQGTAPVAHVDRTGHVLALGTPVALIEIPAIHVHEVIGEGTTAGVLMSGPGLRRDTPLPGQVGTSVVLGRSAAYGGPFRRLDRLRAGTKIKVTTGQGVSAFTVIGHRHAGDRVPSLAAGAGRLSLATADGSPFVPSGVLWVDAALTSGVLDAPSAALTGLLPPAERPLGTDRSTLWALVLWLQLLIAIAVGTVWSWNRWGRHQTWIVFGPFAIVIGLAASGQVVRLLPNLL